MEWTMNNSSSKNKMVDILLLIVLINNLSNLITIINFDNNSLNNLKMDLQIPNTLDGVRLWLKEYSLYSLYLIFLYI